MKKFLITLIILFSALSANAYDFEKFSVSGGADAMANYTFRGVNLGGLSVQPWAEISSYGFTFGAWGNIGSGPYDDFNRLVPELDLYLSYTTPLDIFTIKITQLYYFDGSKYFNFSYDPEKVGSTQTELEGYFQLHPDYPVIIGAAVQVGGGDCWTLYGGYDIVNNDSTPKKMWSTYMYVKYDWEINEFVSWENEIGFSPHKSCYTYYNPDSKLHAPFAVNNISSVVTYTPITTDLIEFHMFAGIRFNLFDVGYDTFTYGKNFGWNLGLGFSL